MNFAAYPIPVSADTAASQRAQIPANDGAMLHHAIGLAELGYILSMDRVQLLHQFASFRKVDSRV